VPVRKSRAQRRDDILVANDTVRNFFFHNQRDGTFAESGEFFGLAYDRDGNATGAMGVDVAHYRNDSELGVLIGNFANEMTSIYVSQGDQQRQDRDPDAPTAGTCTRGIRRRPGRRLCGLLARPGWRRDRPLFAHARCSPRRRGVGERRRPFRDRRARRAGGPGRSPLWEW
jgi:hypothetical protein